MGPAQPRSLLAMLLQIQAPGSIIVTEKHTGGKASLFPSLMHDLLGSDGPPNRPASAKTKKATENQQVGLGNLPQMAGLAGPPATPSKQWVPFPATIPVGPETEGETSPASANATAAPDSGQASKDPGTPTVPESTSALPAPAGALESRVPFADQPGGPMPDDTSATVPDETSVRSANHDDPAVSEPETPSRAAQCLTATQLNLSTESSRPPAVVDENSEATPGAVPGGLRFANAPAEPELAVWTPRSPQPSDPDPGTAEATGEPAAPARVPESLPGLERPADRQALRPDAHGSQPSRDRRKTAVADAAMAAAKRHTAALPPAGEWGLVGRSDRKPIVAAVVETSVSGPAPNRAEAVEPRSALSPKAQTPPADSLPPVPQCDGAALVDLPNLAFAARLISMTSQPQAAPLKAATPNPPGAVTPRTMAVEPESQPLSPIGETAPAATSEDSSRNQSSADTAESKDDLPPRARKTTTAQPPSSEPPLMAAKAPVQALAAPPTQTARIASEAPSAPDPKPQSLDETGSVPAATAPKPPLTAHDIRLEVRGEDQRVQVRLVERGGEVHVAVRTQDNHLAETLREDLPGLSSRLTESGFHTETWRPTASASAEWHRPAETSNNTSPDSNGQPRQNGRESQQENQHPGRPKIPREEIDRKEKGKDFEWFISTTR